MNISIVFKNHLFSWEWWCVCRFNSHISIRFHIEFNRFTTKKHIKKFHEKKKDIAVHGKMSLNQMSTWTQIHSMHTNHSKISNWVLFSMATGYAARSTTSIWFIWIVWTIRPLHIELNIKREKSRVGWHSKILWFKTFSLSNGRGKIHKFVLPKNFYRNWNCNYSWRWDGMAREFLRVEERWSTVELLNGPGKRKQMMKKRNYGNKS